MDLSLLLLVFSLIFTVVSRLLLLYSTVDKTVKDEKFLHSEGHPEKFTELHGEEKKEEGVRGDPNVQLAHLLRQMLTVQNPKKSQLAKKPACSLVDNVSQGL